MREIKFRAWEIENKKMVYPVITDIATINHKNFVIQEEKFGTSTVVELMQYTGLKNFVCSEIYEADIVKGKYWIDGKEYPFIGEVKFLAPSFQVVGINEYKGMNQELHPLYEVIGNIYEHSHLLEDNQ